MIDSKNSLKPVINTIVSLVRNIQLKRVLTRVNPDPGLNFWRLMHGNLLDMAVLDWCKLFGSDDQEHQPVHWKNVIDNQAAFREGLLLDLEMDEYAWISYWREMKCYRDTHVAHSDFRKPDVTHFPKLDHALKSAFFYYAFILRELRQAGIDEYPEDIREYAQRFIEHSESIAKSAVSATSDIEERVF
jgi:hypothetical protein